MCRIPDDLTWFLPQEEPEYAEVDQADGTASRFQAFRPGIVYPADAELVRSLAVRQGLSDLEVQHHDGTVSLFRLADVRVLRYGRGAGAAAGDYYEDIKDPVRRLCHLALLYVGEEERAKWRGQLGQAAAKVLDAIECHRMRGVP